MVRSFKLRSNSICFGRAKHCRVLGEVRLLRGRLKTSQFVVDRTEQGLQPTVIILVGPIVRTGLVTCFLDRSDTEY